jgi:hypothetical protein
VAATPTTRRALWLTLLALAVAPAAFALDSGGSNWADQAAPASLNVSTSLDSCGLGGYQVICKLDVSYSSAPGASSYTATVTDANGTVTDYGAVGAGSTTLYVPYVGPGSYSVRITAYGTPPQPGGRGNVIATGTDQRPAEATVSDARGNNVGTESKPGARTHHADAAGAAQTNTPGNDTSSGQQESANPPPSAPTETTQDPGTGTTTTTTPPAVCEPPDPELNPLPPDNDPDNDDEDLDGVSDAEELAAAAAGSQLTLPATAPTTPECPTP